MTRPSVAQRRLIAAITTLVAEKGGPVVLGDALTAAGEPAIQRSTVDVCLRAGWIVRGDGPAGAPVWDVTPGGRAEVDAA